MTKLRKAVGREQDTRDHDATIDYVLGEWDEILDIYAMLGIQVDAEFPQEHSDDDESDPND